MENKIFLEWKLLLFQPLEPRGESSASHFTIFRKIFTIFSKKRKVQNCRKSFWFNEYLGFACYHTTWKNMAPTIINAQAKGKFQAFWYLNKIHRKPVSVLRLQKIVFKIQWVRLEFLSKLFRKIAQKSLKSHLSNCFASLHRVACWCHAGLKVYGNI